MSAWYYVKGGEWFGPVGGDDLKRLAAVGLIRPGDLVWREGAEGWVAASRVKGLVPAPTGAGAITAIPPLPSPGAFDDLAATTSVREPASDKPKPRRRKLLIWAGGGGVTLAGLLVLVACLISLTGQRGNPSVGLGRPGESWDSHSVITCNLKYPNGAKALALSPDGKLVACCGNEFPLTLYDVASSSVKATMETKTTPLSRSIAFSTDGKYIAYVAGRKIIVNATAAQDVRATLDVHQSSEGNSFFHTYLTFSPDGKFLATASNSSNRNAPAEQVKLWDASSWLLKAEMRGCHPLAFSPDGKTLAMRTGSPYTRKEGNEDSSITIREIAAGKELAKLQADGKGPSRYGIEALAFSSDGTVLAALHGQEIVNLWDVKTGTVAKQIKPDFGVAAIAFSPDGKTLAAVGGVPKNTTTGITVIWDLESDTEARLEGHSGWVEAVAFSQAGDLLATMSCDRTVRLWKKRQHDKGQFVFRSKGAAPPVGDSSPADLIAGARDTIYTKNALSLRKGFQGNVKKSDPGSRADFMQAVEMLGGTFGHKMNEGGITKYQLALQCDLGTWTQVFGEPAKLSDGYDSFTKRKYQRWRHTCTDGPVTIHGNLIPRQQGSVLQCTRLCLY